MRYFLFLLLFSSNCFAVQYHDCNYVQMDMIHQATVEASKTLEKVLYLDNTILFKKWFKENDKETLLKNYLKIKIAIDEENYNFNCDCDENSFAYVWSNDPSHTIHLCNYFWDESNFVTLKTGGVIIHEISHFRDVLYTDDIAKTKQKSLDLSAEDAIRNSYSYEFLANEIPYQ